MKLPRSRLLKHTVSAALRWFCLPLLLSLPALARADADTVAGPWGAQIALGSADHNVQKIDLGLAYNPGWSWWPIGGWHFAFQAEGHVAYWRAVDGNVNPDLVEVGVTPVLRFIRDSGAIRPFFEAGVGVRAITHPYIASDYTLSTAFQFADMVGVGAQFGARQQYQAGFRFQHLSNAHIKEPNPGIDFSQLYFQYNF